MLTDFQNSFTDGLCNKFAAKPSLYFPSHLVHVTTLACEIQQNKKSQKYETFNTITAVYFLSASLYVSKRGAY